VVGVSVALAPVIDIPATSREEPEGPHEGGRVSEQVEQPPHLNIKPRQARGGGGGAPAIVEQFREKPSSSGNGWLWLLLAYMFLKGRR
jgi:hypothetical protein